MIYDTNPPYPHYAHLPYSKEPWKALYVFQRLLTTLALVPVWAATYAILPRRYRPRPSWSIRQIINVNFTRRIFKVTEVAGVTWQTRDPTIAPDPKSLKESRFVWVDPLPTSMRTGIVQEGSNFERVGCYVWPKEELEAIKAIKRPDSGGGPSLEGTIRPLPPSPIVSGLNSGDKYGIERGEIPLVGIFMHGGGYCHMSAHESARTSRIPRNLVKRKILHEVYSVEYRLLQVAPFPAVVQDAAAVYAHVVHHYGFKHQKCKIILIGDSSGGNLVLSLSRWLRDESHLPLPHGLLLLSPSCDASHALPETLSAYIPRPNAETDYLVDTPEPRTLLQRTFFGFKHKDGPNTAEEERRLMEVVHSEYVSPCSPFVLKRWGHDVVQDEEGTHTSYFHRHVKSSLPPAMRLARDPENLASMLDSPYHKSSRFPKLFGDFPRSLVVLGDAERLVREVKSLVVAMEKDGIDVKVHSIPDGAHDVLIFGESWWDRKVMQAAWEAIAEWMREFNSTDPTAE